MSYVLVGILFLVIAGAFIAYLMVTGSRRAAEADRSPDDATDAGAPGIGPDETPFGDTSEHADATGSPGDDDDGPRGAGAPAPERRFQRDPGGGEAEARPFTDA